MPLIKKQKKDNYPYISAQRFADLVLDMGTYLLSSGAHCGRVNSNLSRIAKHWGFDMNINPSFTGLLVNVRAMNDETNTVTSFRKSPTHNVHLAILTDISHLTWRIIDEDMDIAEAELEFSCIKERKSYNNYLVTIAVGLSCAGLCIFAGGDIYNALVALVAASIGYILRQKITALDFNVMIAIGIAAFVTTLFTAWGSVNNIGANPEAAMATAVLYLIPGVPLINCVIDLIEGYLSSAINRALFGGFILLCIAAGMTLCITLMGINNFSYN